MPTEIPSRLPNQDDLPIVKSHGTHVPPVHAGKHGNKAQDAENADLGLSLALVAKFSPALATTLGTLFMRQRVNATIRNPEGRVGRNDACPCGCGEKFKNCPTNQTQS